MLLIHVVTAEESGLTLHQLLRGPMALSGRQTRDAKAQGAVTVDDAPFFSNQAVCEGMTVKVHLNDYQKRPSVCQASSISSALDVIWEDDSLLAVFKPALLQCHPSPSAPNGSDTLEGRVHAYLGRAAHPVHRLDAETTGIVLFAKIPYAQAHLQQQMQQGSFQKIYQAWVYGKQHAAEFTIDAPIMRENPDSFTRIVSPYGQHAVSNCLLLDTRTLLHDTSVSLLQLSPVTGRTHQLRVHMTHIGCPLLGDTRYYTSQSCALSERLSLTHHQLAAVSLSFVHPFSGNVQTILYPAHFDFNPDHIE